jgi:hypothetical protein
MISRRTILVSAAISAIALADDALAKSNKPSAVERFDTDHDGTVDLAEAKKAAQRFNSADSDRDGSVSAAEFGTPAEQALLRLLN